MKAVKVHEFGGPEVLQFEDVERPTPKRGEVLVEVHASSINPVDIKSIEPDSRYKDAIHFPLTPGMDIAGTIVEIGQGVIHFKKGDHVFGQASALRNGSGAFAEYAVTKEDSIARIPDHVDFNEAAALPLVACSAYQAIAEYMKVRRGQNILIHGGSGGIGMVAIQLAKHLGAHVTTTVSGEGVEFAKSIGADVALDYKTTSFEDAQYTYDAILDTIGGETYTKSFEVLRKGGIIVSMLNKPDEALMKQHHVTAVLEMTSVNRRVLTEIAKLVELGIIKVNVAKVYPLDETKEAYEAKKNEKIIGKIAIEISH